MDYKEFNNQDDKHAKAAMIVICVLILHKQAESQKITIIVLLTTSALYLNMHIMEPHESIF